jgi:hypothetical protein
MSRPVRTAVLALCALLLLAAPAAAKSKKGSTLKLKGGATTLTLDQGAIDALTSLGIAAAPLAPATADGADLRFPLTTGRVKAKTLAGKIRHVGGLALSRESTRVELRNFIIDTKKGVLTARVGDARLAILDLDLSDAEVTKKGKRLTVSGVKATLTQGAAEALNGAFATDAFKEGLLLGTAEVKTRATPRR